MKKLLLLLTPLALATGAQAQVAGSSVVKMNTIEDSRMARGLHAEAVQGLSRKTITGNGTAANNGTANKGTGNHSRYFNYVNYLALSINPDIAITPGYASAPYLWYNDDMYGIYQGTAGLERDTITMPAMGAILMPQFSGFNTVDWDPGTMIVGTNNAYTVDSVIFFGTYGRNNAKQSIVDTIFIDMTYGDGTATSNITTRYYTGMAARYGRDTVRSGFLNYNTATHGIGTTGTTGATVIRRRLLVRSTDTGSNKRWAVAGGFTVPAGNFVGTSLTFRSGETYVPYSDTAFRGTVNTAAPYKYGMVRPYVYKQDLTSFPTYTPGNYNSGQFASLPGSATGSMVYFPNWAWTTANGSAPASLQYTDVDVLISCPTCSSLNVKQVSPALVGNAFPNPANNTVSLPITMKQAGTVNVTLTNLVGQAMATQNLGAVAAGQKTAATFSTAGIANGVYFLTVEANGARTTTRFVVAH